MCATEREKETEINAKSETPTAKANLSKRKDQRFIRKTYCNEETANTINRALKKARVVPIYKSGDKSLMNKYRTISILSFYVKVFEKLMYNKLYNFIEVKDKLCAHQYRFRRGHFTHQASITLIDKITKSVNSDDSPSLFTWT